VGIVTDFFVSPEGDDGNIGSEEHPFGTVGYGVTQLHPGDGLRLMTGTYYEQVRLEELGAEDGAPIVISAAEGHRATIDAARRDFVEHPAQAWEPVPPVGPVVAGALPGPETTPMQVVEYKSCEPLPQGMDRGAFTTTRPSYTRLITYGMVRDLQAENQRFGKLPPEAADPPGPMVLGADENSPFPRRPWVYMGPGLWQDKQRYLHVRLSHTTLGVPGGDDYEGEPDPRKVPLAIWGGDDFGQALAIRQCHNLRVRNITVRHGAPHTVLVANSSDVSLDHLTVNAGNYGIRIGEGCENVRITNTVVDGGLPPWFFRSDRKDDYNLANGSHNYLGKWTLNQLIASHTTARGTWIEHCEFVNGHDLQLNGTDVTFTKNWVRNLNDDGIFIGKVATNLRILCNVMEQCLMAINITTNSSVGQIYVHRNLIDLRIPTLGRRPHPHPELMPDQSELEPLRYGNLLKDGKADPELNLSHNTVLVVDQEIGSSYNVFRSYGGSSWRRAYNNIFLAINRTSAAGHLPIAFLPKPEDQSETNGNCYYRIGHHSAPMFAVRKLKPRFADLADLYDSDYFGQSVIHHPPGFEADGIDLDPRLRRYWPPFELPGVEDLRLAESSPARHHGIPLQNLLPGLDPATEAPDIGCYPFESPPLEVGVDGRRHFPGSGVVEPLPPVLVPS
jgi:hypothetical protein